MSAIYRCPACGSPSELRSAPRPGTQQVECTGRLTCGVQGPVIDYARVLPQLTGPDGEFFSDDVICTIHEEAAVDAWNRMAAPKVDTRRSIDLRGEVI